MIIDEGREERVITIGTFDASSPIADVLPLDLLRLVEISLVESAAHFHSSVRRDGSGPARYFPFLSFCIRISTASRLVSRSFIIMYPSFNRITFMQSTILSHVRAVA